MGVVSGGFGDTPENLVGAPDVADRAKAALDRLREVCAATDEMLPIRLALAIDNLGAVIPGLLSEIEHLTTALEQAQCTIRAFVGVQPSNQADKLERVLALAEKWRYKGEFGWGAWQEGHGPDETGYALDGAASELLAALGEQ